MKSSWIILLSLVLIFRGAKGILGKLQPCEVETGQTNIILDIEESRGNSIEQRTTPPELPIYGDPYTEIALELIFIKGNPSFRLIGKQLQLLEPLDRDEENLSHIIFQISCTIRSSRKRRNIPIIIRVSDINDNPPEFMKLPYEVTVAESTPVGTTIFRNIQANDTDAGVNGLVEYFIVEGSINTTNDDTLTAADGYGTFSIGFPHQGQVTVAKTLDYERIQKYYVTIVASDRARNATERLSSTTTLTINIADSDDLDPSFIYRGCVLLGGACINPEYSTSVPSGSLQGVLTVSPERIQAVDLDSLSFPIKYSFSNGMPGNYDDYFKIDEQTGVIQQIKAVDTSTAKRYDIIVKAEEISELSRFTTAKLAITVKPVDANPPIIISSAVQGFVDENSSVGTKIVDANGKPIIFKTKDADLTEEDPIPNYIYEFTTPYFSVSNDNYLIVNEEGLDRDPPNPGSLRFQVVAREANTNAASAPLSLTVTLNDVNDNPPKIPMISPIIIISGDSKRKVTQVIATDNDENENAIIKYSIYHVSNNGAKKFTINEKTGEIETRTRMLAGEQYSITVQATDTGGLYSQAIVEVSVSPGPNTKPPHFLKSIYEVQVSEGAEINTTVEVVKAEDPENDPVIYSITSGNDLRQFYVGQENGVISVIRKLDRESLTRYQLTIKAEDNGGLTSSATVNIRVTDINDKNPEFDENLLPYVFNIDEGKSDSFVGIVHAVDADEGINAQISYSIPNDIPFKIKRDTGEIRTTMALDYEKQSEYKFVVTAKDGAPDARLGTASVTVAVRDIPDEVPKFTEQQIIVRVPENVPDLVIATVRAIDPDTIKEITYFLREGPGDLFKVDPKNGQIKTIRGLDYEKNKEHNLVIGTIENDGDNFGDFIKIIIEVDDRNDISPVFISVPEAITVNDNQSIGTIVGTMPAIDSDGTSPGNVVRYEIIGRGKTLKYFQIDPDTGTIRVRDELCKEDDTEYQIDVRAYDMGEPQLSSVATLPIFVRHLLTDPNENFNHGPENPIITNPETLGLAFSDDSYTAGIPEMTKINSTVKLIQIINSKKSTKSNVGFKCEIIGGNKNDIFRTYLDDHACGLRLVKNLDFEKETTHEIQIKLTSHKYFVNPQRSVANIKIIVQDDNDNEPQFIFKSNEQNKRNTFYTVVSPDAEIDTPILQVKAIDFDSGKYGAIKYKIYDNEDNFVNDQVKPAASYFTMTEDTGILKVQRPLRDSKDSLFKFIVEASDNDGEENGSHKKQARIAVNKITDLNRLTLVFSDTAPSEIKNHTMEIEELLTEKTNGYIVGIERFSNRKYLNENGTIVENPQATDVWFYLLDPENEKILDRNSSTIRMNLLEPVAQSEINFAASGIVHATAQGIFGPLEPKYNIQKVKAAVAINDEVFPFALIAISVTILILGVIGIVYICISWSRYKNFKQRMRQYSAPSSPTRYDPVIAGSQNDDNVTNLKEYETQILEMAVPHDGDEDLQLDFSAKNHAFSLDNVSYITRKENIQSSPPTSEATTATITTLRRNNANNINNNFNNSNRQNTFNRTLEINRNNNTNPLALGNGTLTGTLTLGRLKQNSNIYQNGGYKTDSISKNNKQVVPNNVYSTLGRRGNTFHQNFGSHNDLVSNTLGRKNRLNDIPITNPLFHSDLNHTSATNENVTFGKRDFGHLGFSYLNDLDRSEVETTTEL